MGDFESGAWNLRPVVDCSTKKNGEGPDVDRSPNSSVFVVERATARRV